MLTVAAVALFVRAGFWQLDRAEQKEHLLTQFEAGQRSTIDLASSSTDVGRYQRVRARGRYDAAHQILLDNMPWESGRPGYRVLTPFELESGEWWLVDRGWVPLGRTRADLPAIEVGEELRTIHGRIDRFPQPGLRLGEAQPTDGNAWPRVLSFPEHATLERELRRTVAERIVRLEASEPDGYQRAFRAPVTVGPGRHIGYAVQWFAFAATAVILFLVLSFRKTRP